MKARLSTGREDEPARRRSGGFAVIVLLALLALVLIFVGFNMRTLDNLKREVRAVERQQIQRVQRSQTITNTGAMFTATNTIAPPVSGAK